MTDPKPLSSKPFGALAFGTIGAFVVGTQFLGGLYRPQYWAVLGIAAAVLLLLGLYRGRMTYGPLAGLALLLLAGLAVWVALTVSWSPSGDDGMLEAARWTTYVLVFACGLMYMTAVGAQEAFLRGLAIASSGVALFLAADMAVGGAGSGLFIGGRMVGPVGYANAEAAYAMLGVWSCAAFSCTQRRPAIRALWVAGASLNVSLLLLTQSRGALGALCITLVVLLVVYRDRVTRFLCYIAALVPSSLLVPFLPDGQSIDLRALSDSGGVDAEALGFLLVASALLAFFLALALILGQHLAESHFGTEKTRRLVGSALVALIAVGLILGIVKGNPITRAEGAWRSFSTLASPDRERRFTSSASNRSDYWRVAVQMVVESPVFGAGAGSFQSGYFRERRTSEDIRQPHSVELQLLSENGAVGLILFFGFTGILLVGALRRRDDPTLTVALAASPMFVSWLIQTSVDWIHLVPGVTAAVLLAGGALAQPSEAAVPRRARQSPWYLFTAVPLVACALILARLGFAEILVDSAMSKVVQDPVAAAGDARRSLAYRGANLEALYVIAAAEARTGDFYASRSALLAATELEPENFLPYALLGDLYLRRGSPAAAVPCYASAQMRNPRDPELRFQLRAIGSAREFRPSRDVVACTRVSMR